MKSFLKKYRSNIITITLMIVIGTCMHFICDLTDNETLVKVLGIVFPVNETSWEHMKMFWYPFLAAGIILSKIRNNAGYFGGFVIGGTGAMLSMIRAFALYQSFTTTSVLILDILLFIIIIVLYAMLGYLLARQEWCGRTLPVWIICAVLITAVIIYLTYCPGPGYIFLDNEGLA